MSQTIRVGQVSPDSDVQEKTLTEKQWEAIRDQRNQLIKFMTTVFGWLNGAMIVIIVLGMLADQYDLLHKPDFKDPLIGHSVIVSLVAATVAQAGLAFMVITKFLFPGSSQESGS